jgi:2-C-methyl-D-erythritol 4-phosphate cytidylyltransferase
MANRLPGLKEGRCIGVILEWGLSFLFAEAQTYSMSLHTHSPLRFFAVIPCAGFGSRAGTAMPKQYQTIAGLPMVVHTLKAFAGVQRMAKGVLVLAPDDVHMDDVLAAHPQPLFETSRTGGATRAESVLAGLRELLKQGAHDTDWVLVHDAARCLVTPEQINALIDACQDDAVGGLLAHKLADTLKAEANGRVVGQVVGANAANVSHRRVTKSLRTRGCCSN